MAKELADRLWKDHGVVFLKSFKRTYQPLTVLKVTKGALGGVKSLRVWESDKPLACFQYDPLQELPEVKVISQQAAINVLTEHMTDVKATLQAAVGAGGTAQGQGGSKSSAEYDLTFHCMGVDLGAVTQFVTHLCSPGNGWKDITKDSADIFNRTQEAVAVVLEVYYARRVKASAQQASSGSAALQGSAAGFNAGASASGSTGSKSQITMDTSSDQPFAFSFVLVNYNPKTKRFDIDDAPQRPKAVREATQHYVIPQVSGAPEDPPTVEDQPLKSQAIQPNTGVLEDADKDLLRKLAAEGNEVLTVQVAGNRRADLEVVLESLGYALLRTTKEGHVYATKAVLQSLYWWPFSSSSSSSAGGGGSSSSGTPAAGAAGSAGGAGTSRGPQAGQPSSGFGAHPAVGAAQQNATPVPPSACCVCQLVLHGEVPVQSTLQSSVTEAAGSRPSPAVLLEPVAGEGDKIVLKSQDTSSGTDKRVTAILHVCIKPPVVPGGSRLLCVTLQHLEGCIKRKPGVQPANNQEMLVGVEHLYVSVAANHGDKAVKLKAQIPTGALQEALGCPPQRGWGIPLPQEAGVEFGFAPTPAGYMPAGKASVKIARDKPTPETPSLYPLTQVLECNSHLLSDTSLVPVTFKVMRHGDYTKIYHQDFDLNSVAIPSNEQVVFRGLLDAAVEGAPDQRITIMLGAELRWKVAKQNSTNWLASFKATVIPGNPKADAFTASATAEVAETVATGEC